MLNCSKFAYHLHAIKFFQFFNLVYNKLYLTIFLPKENYYYNPEVNSIWSSKIKKERVTKKTISFTIAKKKIRYLGINLTREVKGLYLENYRPLNIKKLRKIQINGSLYYVHGLEE